MLFNTFYQSTEISLTIMLNTDLITTIEVIMIMMNMTTMSTMVMATTTMINIHLDDAENDENDY